MTDNYNTKEDLIQKPDPCQCFVVRFPGEINYAYQLSREVTVYVLETWQNALVA